MRMVTMRRAQTKRKGLLAVIAVVLIGVFATSAFSLQKFSSHQIDLGRDSYPSHILLLAMDSRSSTDAGLPDTLLLIDSSTGSQQQIPRDWTNSRINPSKTLAQMYLGEDKCEPFCSIQGVYALTKLNSDTGDSERLAFSKIVEVVRAEYKLPSLGLVVFDLTWAYSFLNRIGELELDVGDAIPVGGLDNNGVYVEVKRYLEPGPKKLRGEDLFWFARARQGSSNEARMERQIQLLQAIMSQVDNFSILRAAAMSKGALLTDLSIYEVIRFALTIPRIQ